MKWADTTSSFWTWDNKMWVTLKTLLFWRRQWQPTPVLLPGKSYGWRSPVGCSPWGCWESDTTEGLHFHFSLSFIGDGNGNPLQCSCLENPRDGGAWWAAVYGVTQSRTWLKRLSSSNNNHLFGLARWIPWAEKPARLHSIRLQRIRHNWSNRACAPSFI